MKCDICKQDKNVLVECLIEKDNLIEGVKICAGCFIKNDIESKVQTIKDNMEAV